jgi:hypothetical protein
MWNVTCPGRRGHWAATPGWIIYRPSMVDAWPRAIEALQDQTPGWKPRTATVRPEEMLSPVVDSIFDDGGWVLPREVLTHIPNEIVLGFAGLVDGASSDPAQGMTWFADAVHAADSVFGDMSLLDGIGWALLLGQRVFADPRAPWRPRPEAASLRDAGYRSRDWACIAAGLSPVEARASRDGTGMSADEVLMLASLRDFPLPSW